MIYIEQLLSKQLTPFIEKIWYCHADAMPGRYLSLPLLNHELIFDLTKLRYMKYKMVLITLLMGLFACSSQKRLPAVFADQVDAFNKGDIERLVYNVTDDFKWFYITPDTLLLEVTGKENFKTSMESYFSSGVKVLSTIEEYAIDGNRVSFKEVVSHKNKKGEPVRSSAMGVYEIRKGKIYRAWYFID